MRIPSQFNEDSLYGRGRRRSDASKTHRHLIRLVIGLALVIVVMRQASKPGIYRAFFGQQRPHATSHAGGAPVTHTTTTHATALQLTGASPGIIDGEPLDAGDRRVAHELTKTMSPGEQREWVVALSRWQTGSAIEQAPSNLDATQAVLDSLEVEELDDERRAAWSAVLAACRDAVGREPPAEIADADRAIVAAFLASLDAAAAARVVDGSVWRSGDFDTFYRYLDQADRMPDAGVASTGVLPLLQQPDVFRDQMVRVHGGVARAQLVPAKENPYGVTDYWQLWLRPSDGADRPLVAIVRSVPAPVREIAADATEQEGPPVIVVGRFLKRLAYQSSLGADLAPVVVGRVVSGPVPADQTAQSIEASPEPAAPRLWLIAAAAAVIGVGLAVITMWRTSIMEKRARQLRTSHRKEPDEFLRDLKESSHPAEPPST